MTHRLKTEPEPFCAVHRGDKLFEYRKDDRSVRYQVGDRLVLTEWSEATGHTGREIEADVTYVARDAYGIPPGYCVMSIEVRRNG